MKISLEAVEARYHIRSYSDGFIVIQTPDNELQQVQIPLLLASNTLTTGSEVPDINRLEAEGLQQLQSLDLEVLLIAAPGMDFRQQISVNNILQTQAISAEWMAIGPACRTFNLLQQDSRKVALLINSP